MSWYSILADVVKPITQLIDDVHTSSEEKLQIKSHIYEMQSKFAGEMLKYEGELAKCKSDIIKSEAQGASWLQRTWRPITMLTFLVLVVCDSFGLLAFRLSEEAWTLLQIGLGGYVAGRTVEKIVPKMMEKL